MIALLSRFPRIRSCRMCNWGLSLVVLTAPRAASQSHRFRPARTYTREASPRFTVYRFNRTRRNTFRAFRAEIRTVREDQKLAKLTGNLSDRPHCERKEFARLSRFWG